MEHPGPFLISLNIADCLVLPGEFFPSLSFPGLFYCQIRRTLPGTYLAPIVDASIWPMGKSFERNTKMIA